MLDLPLQCHERVVNTELRVTVVLIRTPMQVTNIFACNSMFAPVSILSMVKFVLEYHRLRGCHRLSGYLRRPRGRFQFLIVNFQLMTRALALSRLCCLLTLLGDLRHDLTIC